MTVTTKPKVKPKKRTLKNVHPDLPIYQTADPEDVPGFPTFERMPAHRFSDADIAAILEVGSAEGRRNWLVGAHAKGEITDRQLVKFLRGDR